MATEIGTNNDFLGRGWKNPVQIDPITGGIAVSVGENSVKDSIIRIIGTAIGSRIMNRRFGSIAVRGIVFEPMSQQFVRYVADGIRNALFEQEKRITGLNVRVESQGTRMDIYVNYVLAGTNKVGNVVYPFYLEERAGA